MNTIARWTAQVAVFAAMTLSSAAIAIGLATSAHAAPAVNNPGPATSAQHHAFPSQHNSPQPGSQTHHHHQHNRR
jgi:hypothetical protein